MYHELQWLFCMCINVRMYILRMYKNTTYLQVHILLGALVSFCNKAIVSVSTVNVWLCSGAVNAWAESNLYYSLMENLHSILCNKWSKFFYILKHIKAILIKGAALVTKRVMTETNLIRLC